MENIVQLLIFSSSIVIFFTIPAQSVNSCEPASCDANHGPEVRFPFWLKNRQSERCGNPGFDLECNSQNKTVLQLPLSGEFMVDYIDYTSRALFIEDQGSCLASRALKFSASVSPFQALESTNYVFLNCSGGWMDYAWTDYYVPLFCSGDPNSVFVALRWDSPAVPARCRMIGNASVPLRWEVSRFNPWQMEIKVEFELRWSEPACPKCENRAPICGSKGDSGLEIGCSNSKPSGLLRGAKYAIIIGVGIPGLSCMIGLVCYICSRVKTKLQRHRPTFELPTTTVFDQQPFIKAIRGLDLPTIESYPKTVLGQSRRLPRPSDSTCSICLCEYQPKETLRSIPECNHYFHTDCIDEWLKLNGTCPMCRNSPDSLSNSTPYSSTSVSFSSSSSTTLDHD